MYQKTAEESEARKASLEQAQKEIEQLKQESQQLKTRTGDLSKQIEELVAGNEAAFSQMKQKLDAQAEEMNALKKEKEELVTKAEYLNREVERLKLKSGELSTEKEKEVAHLKETYETLMKEMKEEIDKGEIKITQAVDRLSVNMVEKILFDSGKAEVKPGGLKILNRVGTILKGVTDKQIRIEGHTDNVKIGTRIKEKYPTNWELSTARATNVVRYLQDNIGIDPKLLFAAGY
ncbi:MAG TPA: OmpA family protein [Thermodesulfobacteriota bacterium]|nr:OmpA family protein [Thermodesulfobacteriota bacterium]